MPASRHVTVVVLEGRALELHDCRDSGCGSRADVGVVASNSAPFVLRELDAIQLVRDRRTVPLFRHDKLLAVDGAADAVHDAQSYARVLDLYPIFTTAVETFHADGNSDTVDQGAQGGQVSGDLLGADKPQSVVGLALHFPVAVAVAVLVIKVETVRLKRRHLRAAPSRSYSCWARQYAGLFVVRTCSCGLPVHHNTEKVTPVKRC